MTEPVDENAVLAMLKERLEAEGEAMSNPFPPGVPLDPCTVMKEQPEQNRPTEWADTQHPASITYLRELVQLARESGMVNIRTGNLEIRFDPERVPAKPPSNTEQF